MSLPQEFQRQNGLAVWDFGTPKQNANIVDAK
jgi:hypothetical protein